MWCRGYTPPASHPLCAGGNGGGNGAVVQADHALLCPRDGGHGRSHGHDHDFVGGDDERDFLPLYHRSGVFPCHGLDIEGSSGRVPEPRTLLSQLPALPTMGLDIVSTPLSRESFCGLNA